MSSADSEDTSRDRVVVNRDEQDSIWPAEPAQEDERDRGGAQGSSG